MRRAPLLVLALLSILSRPALSHHVSESPVGAWEVESFDGDRGNTYLTFNEDQTLSGYGITEKSIDLFTITGDWDIADSGQLEATLDYLFETDSGEVTIEDQFTGHVSGGQLFGRLGGESAPFRFRGMPATETPDLTGEWEFKLRVETVTTTTSGSTETITVTSTDRIHLDVAVTALADITGMFTLDGISTRAGDDSTATGFLIVNSEGRVNINIPISSSDQDGNLVTVDTAVAGRLEEKGRVLRLHGTDRLGHLISGIATRLRTASD